MMLLHIEQPKSKAKDQQSMVTNLQIHDRVVENKDYKELTEVKSTEKRIYDETQMNANEMLKWTFLYYDFILSDNLTACCSIGLRHNLLLILFSINLLKLIQNVSHI